MKKNIFFNDIRLIVSQLLSLNNEMPCYNEVTVEIIFEQFCIKKRYITKTYVTFAIYKFYCFNARRNRENHRY